MYRIVGADGNHYGPVDAAQIRQWFADNRVRGETLIQLDGSAEWRPLSDISEFADLFQTGANPRPPQPPPAGASNVDRLVANALARGSHLQASNCLSRGWDLVMNRFWMSVGVGFVCSVISNVPLLQGLAYTGAFWFFLRQIRTGKATFEETFEPFSTVLLQGFLAGLVVTLLVSVGLALCVVPGVILAALWLFTWPLLMDKRLDFWQAMEVSRRVLWPNLGSVLWLWCLSVLLLLAGILCCYVGLFVALPIVAAAHAYAYQDFFGEPPTAPQPA